MEVELKIQDLVQKNKNWEGLSELKAMRGAKCTKKSSKECNNNSIIHHSTQVCSRCLMVTLPTWCTLHKVITCLIKCLWGNICLQDSRCQWDSLCLWGNICQWVNLFQWDSRCRWVTKAGGVIIQAKWEQTSKNTVRTSTTQEQMLSSTTRGLMGSNTNPSNSRNNRILKMMTQTTRMMLVKTVI